MKTYKCQPPSSPSKSYSATQRFSSARKKPRDFHVGFARFFTKQLLLFFACALIIIVVDVFLYGFFVFNVSDEYVENGTPGMIVREVDASLNQNESGTYTLSEAAAVTLKAHNGWAFLIDENGSVIWSENLPEGIPLTYHASDIAMAAHYNNIADYPVFFWDREETLLVVGFSEGTYGTIKIEVPLQIIGAIPLYVGLIFLVNAAILFFLYALSRRRTQNAVAPLVEALDNLSQGTPTHVELKGDLSHVGKRITETSELLQQKDVAQANWIRGVSHDIRTPLSLILASADNLVNNSEASTTTQTQAALIRIQGLKIKDLVTDFTTSTYLDQGNTASTFEPILLPRLLRGVVASHANSNLNDLHPISLEISPQADHLIIQGNGRLLTRAVENAISNARQHNPQGCTIEVTLDSAPLQGTSGILPHAVLSIRDTGVGVPPEKLSDLSCKISQSTFNHHDPTNLTKEHGLGLILVNRITHLHHGFIRLVSTDKKGFTVELFLPID